MNVFAQIQAWFHTWPERRPWRDIPALVATVACIVFGFYLKHWSPASVRARYSDTAREALAARDFATARVACRRLLVLGSESRMQTLFDLAMALQGLGQGREASALLDMVAPFNRPVYAPAHLYVAKCLMTGTNKTIQTVKLAELQLKQVIALQPDSLEANEILGRHYFQEKEWVSARKHLIVALPSEPEFMFLIATACQKLGDTKGMLGWMEHAETLYREKVVKGKSDNPKDRLFWVRALASQGKYAEAMQVADAGQKQFKNNEFRPVIAEICGLWACQIAKKEPENLDARLKLIQQGLGQAPEDERLLALLFAISHTDKPEAKIARETIAKMQVERDSSAIYHFVAGSDAWQQGDTAQARTHFARAFELAPDTPAIANNMAMLLTKGEKQDAPRALGIIQAALEKQPNDPDLRETRGQILVSLGRWVDAVKDLEFALPLVQVKKGAHTALAEAYQGLGMQDLADEHRRLAAPAPVGEK